MFLKAAGVRMRHLPTTGGAPMMNALLGGHAATTASTTVLVSPHVKADKLRAVLERQGNREQGAKPPAKQESHGEQQHHAQSAVAVGRDGVLQTYDGAKQHEETDDRVLHDDAA